MVACVSTGSSSNYLEDYKLAVEPKANFENNGELKNLVELFSDLQHEQVPQRVAKTYANKVYFNDTLHTFTEREALTEYLVDGANRVDEINVIFEDIASSEDNYYVRWVMEMKFKVMGKSIDSKSIGISQIRLDDEGRIIFHQDFWDNTTGFFGHLPVVGGVLNRIKASMK